MSYRLRFYKDPNGKVWPLLDTEKTASDVLSEVTPNTSDGATEKHVPVATVTGKKVHVEIGSILHPMIDVHFIEWIAVETDKGFHIKFLKPGQQPIADFALVNERALTVYEYCNIHGLWKKDLE